MFLLTGPPKAASGGDASLSPQRLPPALPKDTPRPMSSWVILSQVILAEKAPPGRLGSGVPEHHAGFLCPHPCREPLQEPSLTSSPSGSSIIVGVHSIHLPLITEHFPGDSYSKESPCNVGDLGSIPGLRRSPREEDGYPLQYSGRENSMDCIVHGIAKSQT